MRFDAITAAQHRLLIELTGRISTGLATEFEKRSGPEGPNVGVTLAERGKSGRVADQSGARPDALSPAPARPRRDIAPLADPAVWNRENFGWGCGGKALSR